jgi:hypothetical protein
MTRKFRFVAVQLALAALMLRALLPAGWMPNPHGGGAALVVCTIDGAAKPDRKGSGKTVPDSGHQHEECPFAATPHLAAPAIVAQLALPSILGRCFNPPQIGIAAVHTVDYQPQSPRAPPLAI